MMFRWCKALRNLLWPKTCLACSKPIADNDSDTSLCLGCLDSIRLEPGTREKSSFTPAPGFDRLYFACRYQGTVKKLVHRFKYDSRDYLAGFFGRLLTDSARTLNVPLGSIDTVVAVPLHASRLREREYNQAGLLAGRVGQAFGLPVEDGLLIRLRPTRTQTDLRPDLRQENVAGCFTVPAGRSCGGRTILLVDDVVTTGATVSQASLALKTAGARKVYVLALAH